MHQGSPLVLYLAGSGTVLPLLLDPSGFEAGVAVVVPGFVV